MEKDSIPNVQQLLDVFLYLLRKPVQLINVFLYLKKKTVPSNINQLI